MKKITIKNFLDQFSNGIYQDLNLIIGRSGSGKNYICNAVGFSSVPSYTTRAKRDEEKDGREHTFITTEDYFKLCKKEVKGKKIFAAVTKFHNNFYWATREQINDKKYNAYIIDLNGILDFVKRNVDGVERDFNIFFVSSPWYKRLYRMIKRDGLKKAWERFQHDKIDFKNMKKVYKYLLKNNWTIFNFYN